ncbi:MAG: hypothetical protein H7230_01665 [Candidatus Parcubacteria bacterium]|nr:hypothetical protein [Candidatus Paceibacterota bacterium]
METVSQGTNRQSRQDLEQKVAEAKCELDREEVANCLKSIFEVGYSPISDVHILARHLQINLDLLKSHKFLRVFLQRKPESLYHFGAERPDISEGTIIVIDTNGKAIVLYDSVDGNNFVLTTEIIDYNLTA